jgi:hypothetical protein
MDIAAAVLEITIAAQTKEVHRSLGLGPSGGVMVLPQLRWSELLRALAMQTRSFTPPLGAEHVDIQGPGGTMAIRSRATAVFPPLLLDDEAAVTFGDGAWEMWSLATRRPVGESQHNDFAERMRLARRGPFR